MTKGGGQRLGDVVNTPIGWALVAHIIGVVMWVGGLLAASRALALHLRETSADGQAALARLERKLMRGLAHPGAAVAVLGGVALMVIQPAYLQQGWMHAKLGLVILLIVADLWFTFRLRAFHAGRGAFTARQSTLVHAATWLLFFAIVVVVITKP